MEDGEVNPQGGKYQTIEAVVQRKPRGALSNWMSRRPSFHEEKKKRKDAKEDHRKAKWNEDVMKFGKDVQEKDSLENLR